MGYLNNKQLIEIKKKAKDGNEEAKELLKIFLTDYDPKEFDDKVSKLLGGVVTKKEEPIEESEEVQEVKEVANPQKDLAKEIDRILGKDEDRKTFSEVFLSKLNDEEALYNENKNLRLKYNGEDISKILTDKEEKFKTGEEEEEKKIERNYRDLDKAITSSIEYIDTLGCENHESAMSVPYKDIFESILKDERFIRTWDELDKSEIEEKLRDLVCEYGKDTITGILRRISEANNEYREEELYKLKKMSKAKKNKIERMLSI